MALSSAVVADLGPSTTTLRTLVTQLGHCSPATSDAERIDRIRALEEVKAACAAAQAVESVAFKTSQLAEQEAAGVPASQRGRGISAQVALARRESPHKAARLMGLAESLVHEMPATLDALRAGATNEWRATLVVRETACLSRDDRRAVDLEVGPHLGELGDRETAARTQKAAYRLDPHAVVARARKAEAERSVVLRPAPDTMTYLTGLLPVKQGVAAYTALKAAADSLVATGGSDGRSRGQVMADLLVERLTGQAVADQVPVEVQLVIADTTLAGADDEPALLGSTDGLGVAPIPVPAPWARALVRDTDERTRAWIRRLYSRDGRLVALDSTRRLFPQGLRRLLVARDQLCRTPWCGAPIRAIDHLRPHDRGGPTAWINGQGLCVACNLAKQAAGWVSASSAFGDPTIELNTPTGHAYTSRPPPLPTAPPRRQRVDLHWHTPVHYCPAA